MSSEGTKGSGDTVVIGKPNVAKHHSSILEILATIEQYSLCEKEAGNLAEETVTRVTLIHFFEIGLRHGFFTSIPLFLTAPFGFAVIQKVLPLFGKSSYSITDNFFALVLSALPTLATIIFVSVMFSILFHGNITRKCMSVLAQGLLLGKFLGHLIVFVGLHIIYYVFIKDPLLYKQIYSLSNNLKIISPKVAYNIAVFIHSLGDSLVHSAWYVAGLFVVAAIAILVGYYWGKHKSVEFIKFKQKWLLD